MRIEIDEYPSDGSQIPEFGYTVLLDGKYCFFVQIADDEEGFVEAPLINDNCKPCFDSVLDDYLVVRRYGKVKIEPNYSMLKYTNEEEQTRFAKESQFNKNFKILRGFV